MDDTLRRKVIDALQLRRWTQLDAERAADSVVGIYQAGPGEWRVWRSGKMVGQDIYRVARPGDPVSVYNSPLEERAREVADVLNELQGHTRAAPGAP